MAVSRPQFASKFLSIEKIELSLFLVTIWLKFYTTDVFKNPVRIFLRTLLMLQDGPLWLENCCLGLWPLKYLTLGSYLDESLKKDPVL